MTSDLRRGLQSPAPRGRSVDSAQRFMLQRGYTQEPVGFIEVDELCTYYYFDLPSGAFVELEVIYEPASDTFTRCITGLRCRERELAAS
jgi:hypothetical protein